MLSAIDEYIVLDLETTGFSPSNCEIIEMVAIKVRNNEIVDTFQSFVKPKNDIPEYITGLTGISHSMVENAKGIEYVFKDFLEFINSHYVVGHNVSFDISFIKHYAEMLCLDVDIHGTTDTLYYSRKYFKDVPNHKLSTLIEHFKIPQKPTHRALDDCIATNELYKKILECEKSADNSFLQTHINSVKENSLSGKRVVFKGVTSLCSYNVYSALCERAGGTVDTTFYANRTDYLVFGKTTYAKFMRHDYSEKMYKACDLAEKGYLEILSEYDFLKLIGLDMPKPQNAQGYLPHKAIDIKSIVPTTDDFDEAHPLFGKVCVFTGTLEKMPRIEAMQRVVDLGGKIGSGVTKKTNYLILGCNDFCPLIKDGKSNKQKKAEEYKAAGYDIEIIDEDIFYGMLDD